SMEGESNDSCGENQGRFFEPELQAPEVSKAGKSNDCSREVDDGPSREHHGCAGDGPCRSGSCSFHEGTDSPVLPMTNEPATRNDYAEVDWSKDSQAGCDRTRQTAH